MNTEHHIKEVVGGLPIFSCVKKNHSYKCYQNFDYCPSCGEDLNE